MTTDTARKQRFTRIILAYPFALILVGLAINAALFGVSPAEISLPSKDIVVALVVAAVLLVANHTWLITSTELTRLRYGLHATPEEWKASGTSPDEASAQGVRELERRHNAHRNATENTVYFAFAILLMSVVTPTVIALQVWIAVFAIGRLGHTYSYLHGKDGTRGLFMSMSLLALYGSVSYLVISLF
ncbi:MAG: MAPEG family protein [Alphaproteobacteria bacterium]|nr:MAPEG family protein [Alphaproteobacteria bacterium]